MDLTYKMSILLTIHLRSVLQSKSKGRLDWTHQEAGRRRSLGGYTKVHAIISQTRKLNAKENLAKEPLEAETLKNYPFTSLQCQMIFKLVLKNLSLLKDKRARGGKYLKHRHHVYFGKDLSKVYKRL